MEHDLSRCGRLMYSKWLTYCVHGRKCLPCERRRSATRVNCKILSSIHLAFDSPRRQSFLVIDPPPIDKRGKNLGDVVLLFAIENAAESPINREGTPYDDKSSTSGRVYVALCRTPRPRATKRGGEEGGEVEAWSCTKPVVDGLIDGLTD